ncbi:DUF4124 domain-containing protein [Acinetobacter sp. NIPH 2699]|uniref:DUF4124 domain-containing protein n=1 Tax=Acinetobacter sp. NIPH 2699 TaxID=2923433 RepID=UPI001F4B3BB0|nr:DUF4124 domain-containing protein [Acinetobacter sp. NIPH 2699]MCH7337605.1 DUF4124 domain-containing protein [Acinetobacter sp. NIPH 2699]
MKASLFKTISYAVSATVLLLCTSQSQAQQYYKWVDANGSTHYTTTPPPKGTKRLDKVATYATHHTHSPSTKTQDTTKEAQNAPHHTEAVTEEAVTPSASTASTASER